MSARFAPSPAAATDLISHVFDALPQPAFIVDRDFSVIDFNLAGARLLERIPFAVLRPANGVRLECLHAGLADNGADIAPCQDCTSGNFVRTVFQSGPLDRKAMRIRLTQDQQSSELDFLVTVVPIVDGSESLALLMMEERSGLAMLLSGQAV